MVCISASVDIKRTYSINAMIFISLEAGL